MTLHLIKLAVGPASLEHLCAGLQARAQRVRISGAADSRPAVAIHTRNFPKRADELLDGGSLYWVIKSRIQARCPILGLERIEADDGRKACLIWVSPRLVPTAPQPKRPFQGWRYFKGQDAPRDLNNDGVPGDMPEDFRQSLADAGLI